MMTDVTTHPLSREQHEAFLALYNSSFGADERRDYADSAALEGFIRAHNDRFHVQTVSVDGALCGFISYWDFGAFAYVEHLAIAPAMRSEGLGSLLLADLLDVQPRVILEVERPEDNPSDRARHRRLAFYKRHDFCIHRDVEYLQPAYAPGKTALPMYLATAGYLQPTEQVIATIHREVYGSPREV